MHKCKKLIKDNKISNKTPLNEKIAFSVQLKGSFNKIVCLTKDLYN